MLDDFELFIMLCPFFYDAIASMSSTINFFLNQSNQSDPEQRKIINLTTFVVIRCRVKINNLIYNLSLNCSNFIMCSKNE